MHIRAHRGRSHRTTLLSVLFAVAALLTQAMLPAASLAAESRGAVRIELCTPEGAKTVILDHDGQVQRGFAGLPCHDCLGPSLAVTTTPTLSMAPIVYRADRIAEAAIVEVTPRGARAPPRRPPGQGPPVPTL